MNEELKKLFESSVLNDDTKDALQEAFNTAVEAKETEMKADYDAKLKESVSEINSFVGQMIEEAVADNLSDIADEINEARSLEVTYAEKLETFKENYADKVDEFIKESTTEIVAEELAELKEDIELAKKHQFALKLQESFGEVYAEMFGGADIDAASQLKEAKQELDGYKRKEKLAELLEGVDGSKRKVAETVLESVSLDKMESKFESIKSYLLSESVSEEDEDNQINESEENKQSDDKNKGTVVLENQEEDSDDAAVNENVSKVERSLKLI